MAGRHDDSLSFTIIDAFRAGSETRIAAKPDLDEDDRYAPIARVLSQDEVDLAEFAAMVPRQGFHALAAQVILRRPFRPCAAFSGRHDAR